MQKRQGKEGTAARLFVNAGAPQAAEPACTCARANLQRLRAPPSGPDAFSIGSSDRDVGQLGGVTGKSVSCKPLTMMSRYFTDFPALLITLGLGLSRRRSIAGWGLGVTL